LLAFNLSLSDEKNNENNNYSDNGNDNDNTVDISRGPQIMSSDWGTAREQSARDDINDDGDNNNNNNNKSNNNCYASRGAFQLFG